MNPIFVAIAIAVATLLSFPPTPVTAQDWNQWRGSERDGHWNESGIVNKFPDSGPDVVWRTPIHAGYAGPAVAGGRVVLMDYEILEGDPTPNPGRKNELKGIERVLCLDAETGEPLWEHRYERDYKISYPAGPRATPTIYGDHVYTLGAEGDLKCLRISDGQVVWEKQLKQAYGHDLAPHWGFASHPLVTESTVYCVGGGTDGVAVALDRLTGEEKWQALPASEPGYCPPVMIDAGGVTQLIIWHPEALNGVNPQTGEVYWSVEMKPMYGMSIVAPVHYENYLYTAALQGASILVELAENRPAAEVVWRNQAFGTVHSPPMIVDGHIYGVGERGRIRCCELATGEQLWETDPITANGRPANSATGFMVRNGDRFFIATETGELIIARLTPDGYNELDRASLLEPTSQTSGRQVVWSHPAFAQKCVFARNDEEIICVSLAE